MPHFGPTFFSFPSFFFFHFVNPKLTNPKPKRGKKEDQTGTLFMYKKKKDIKKSLSLYHHHQLSRRRKEVLSTTRAFKAVFEKSTLLTRARARALSRIKVKPHPREGKTRERFCRYENLRIILSSS
jgi:hypothetical protein